MKLHELKIEDKYFWDVTYGKKTAEVRKNDRDYQVGDILCLKNIQRSKGEIIYTGLYIMGQITHVLTGEEFSGIANGYAMLSFIPLIQVKDKSNDIHYYNAKEDERTEEFEYDRDEKE